MIMFFILTGIWLTPTYFGKGVDPKEVDHIIVFDGSHAEGFTIDKPDDIKWVVEAVQNMQLKKKGISFGRSGYVLSIGYVDDCDNPVIPIFFIISENCIQRTPFLYTCESKACIEHLMSLEKQYVEDSSK